MTDHIWRTMTDYMRDGSTVRDLATDHPCRVRSVSRNLRGLVDYARRAAVVCVITRRDSQTPVRGELRVVYADGTLGAANFASHAIMIDWVRNRRTWRAAEMRHLDGALGYLTRPGVIAGA